MHRGSRQLHWHLSQHDSSYNKFPKFQARGKHRKRKSKAIHEIPFPHLPTIDTSITLPPMIPRKTFVLMCARFCGSHHCSQEVLQFSLRMMPPATGSPICMPSGLNLPKLLSYCSRQRQAVYSDNLPSVLDVTMLQWYHRVFDGEYLVVHTLSLLISLIE